MNQTNDMMEAAKKAFLIAHEGYMNAVESVSGETFESIKENLSSGRLKDKLFVDLSPIAAQIYRQLTQMVVVTVDDAETPEMERLGKILRNEGYRGIITSGNVSYHFPDHGTIEVTIEKNNDEGGDE